MQKLYQFNYQFNYSIKLQYYSFGSLMQKLHQFNYNSKAKMLNANQSSKQLFVNYN